MRACRCSAAQALNELTGFTASDINDTKAVLLVVDAPEVREGAGAGGGGRAAVAALRRVALAVADW